MAQEGLQGDEGAVGAAPQGRSLLQLLSQFAVGPDIGIEGRGIVRLAVHGGDVHEDAEAVGAVVVHREGAGVHDPGQHVGE